MAKKDKAKEDGGAAFARWYGEAHGERWADLAAACAAPNRHFRLDAGLAQPYFLDPASVLAALCLDVRPGMRVLDLCAAPGGKSLVLAQRLFGLVPPDADANALGTDVLPESAPAAESEEADDLPPAPEAAAQGPDAIDGTQLVANELSSRRRGRLRQVLFGHLPPACHGGIRIAGHDAAGWGQHEQDAYDRILLDVPCSSERHLIQDPAWLKEWSPRRSSQLAQQAYAMGLSAGRALRPGGRLLYCTCALADQENDGAVGRIVERSAAQAGRYGYRLEAGPPEPLAPAVRDALGRLAEPTRFGLRIWPDRSGGLGPLYFSLIRKVDA